VGVAVEKMEEQLRLWSLKIDRLAAKTEMAGARTGFDALMYVDELKAMHAIARSKFDEFRAANDPERARLEPELKSAWNELEAAFTSPKRSRKG